MVKDLNDPTNVDSVPAMLTPGEFVLNKEASQMYAGIIEQMNNHGLEQRKAENRNMGGMIPNYNDGGIVQGYNIGGWLKGLLKPDPNSVIGQQQAGNILPAHIRANPPGYGAAPPPPEFVPQAQPGQQVQGGFGPGIPTEFSGNYRPEQQPTYITDIPQVGSGAQHGRNTVIPSAASIPNIKGEQANLGLPAEPEVPKFSDEDLIQNSSESVVESFADPLQGYAAYSPQDFLNEAQPQGVKGGGADPSYDPHAGRQVQGGFGAEIPNFTNIPQAQEGQQVQGGFGAGIPEIQAAPEAGPYGESIPGEDLAFAQPVPQGQPSFYGAAVPQSQNIEENKAAAANLTIPTAAPTEVGASKKSFLEQLRYPFRSQEVPQYEGIDAAPPGVDDKLPGLGGAFAGYAGLSKEELLEEALNPGKVEPSAEELAQSAFQNPDATEEELEAAKAVYNADTTDDDRARANDKLRKEVGLESTAEVKESLTQDQKGAEVVLANSAIKEEVDAAPSPIAGQGNNPDEGASTDQVVETGKKASPKQMSEAKTAVKEAFGDLFDKKELARMGVLFAGALLTGATPAQALAISGQSYLQRIDAKEANHQKRIDGLVKSGKHSPASIKAYSESGDPTDLVALTTPPKRTGNFKTLYGPNGAVKVEEVKFGDVTKQVDARGNFINEFQYSDDASSQTYTPEGRQRLQSESKEYAGILKEAQDVVIEANKAADKGTVNTGILPKAAGNEAAKWAIENNIPPAGMGRLLTNAFDSAQRDGKSAKSIVPYLNEQFVQASVGDPTNFKFSDGKTVPAQKTNQWLNTASNALRRANPDTFGGKSNTEISQFILGSSANKEWNNLSTEDKASYAKAGKPMGYSGWMYYINDQLQ